MSRIIMRATFDEVDPDDTEDVESGYTDPCNPWGGLDATIPYGLCGAPSAAWRDENAKSETFDALVAAARFAVEFEGGVWKHHKGHEWQDTRTGVYRTVTLHIDGSDEDVAAVFELMDAMERIQTRKLTERAWIDATA